MKYVSFCAETLELWLSIFTMSWYSGYKRNGKGARFGDLAVSLFLRAKLVSEASRTGKLENHRHGF